jgi:hypothetical protein
MRFITQLLLLSNHFHLLPQLVYRLQMPLFHHLKRRLKRTLTLQQLRKRTPKYLYYAVGLVFSVRLERVLGGC